MSTSWDSFHSKIPQISYILVKLATLFHILLAWTLLIIQPCGVLCTYFHWFGGIYAYESHALVGFAHFLNFHIYYLHTSLNYFCAYKEELFDTTEAWLYL